jgi:putative heme-binding domain-containing protein
MKPHLLCLNLNGMVAGGDAAGQKIVPLGRGELDLKLLKIIQQSGYTGLIGILNHTQHDAEARLLDNIDGLKWLTRQLDGTPPQPLPALRSPDQPAPEAGNASAAILPYSTQRVVDLLHAAQQRGNAARGAVVFSSPKFACLSCHRIGEHGGQVGPDLAAVLPQRSLVELTESFLWPQRDVPHAWLAWSVVTTDGQQHRGYVERQTARDVLLRDPVSKQDLLLKREDIDDMVRAGSLMPDGLATAMSPQQRADVLRLLMETQRAAGDLSLLSDVSAVLAHAAVHAHAPATFDYASKPLDPAAWPYAGHHVNRERLYDFYRKQALHFRDTHPRPPLLTQYPGLDGGQHGHWGNQDDTIWADGRWNNTDLGNLQCGVLRGHGLTIPRAVCVRLSAGGPVSACFNPDTLQWEAVWTGGFVGFSDVRHGFVGGIQLQGTVAELPVPPDWSEFGLTQATLRDTLRYRGFVRYGAGIALVYRAGDTDILEVLTARDGGLVRALQAGAPDSLPLAAQWPQVIETKIQHGGQSPWAIDTIELPWENPWQAQIFPGGHAFLPDGAALVCTMQGDVWHVSGFQYPSQRAVWRRFASGLHQALGIHIDERGIFVLGRDQITRLHDLNSDGEADFYECFSNAFETSAGGHDFICGLQCDEQGRFYLASGNQGLVRVSADGQTAEVLATGFRNPDGLGVVSQPMEVEWAAATSRHDTASRPRWAKKSLSREKQTTLVTVPCSEGGWTPATMICAVHAAAERESEPPFFGFGGPRAGAAPSLPLVYLPRGLDNSAGGQCVVESDRWGPLTGHLLHFSFGTCTHHLLLTDSVDGILQGAVVPLPGEFRSGVHRGRFHPDDGQLYVTGMQGWGTYAVDDGCFERVRFTGDKVQQPVGWKAHQNGVAVRFTSALDESVVTDVRRHFVQCWNYRYSPAYGSPEFVPSHYGTMGHETLAVQSVHVLDDGRTLFLEIPDLQPVNQLHLLLGLGDQDLEMFATVHALAEPRRDVPNYQPIAKELRPHPIEMDLRLLAKSEPNPFEKRINGAREIDVAAVGNLSYGTRTLRVTAGEAVQLTFENRDVVPHNWALADAGQLAAVGALCNQLVSDPDAVFRQYIPETEHVLVWTDIVSPKASQTIWFRAPEQPGHYPFLCTFPGHWPVMNGVLIVE